MLHIYLKYASYWLHIWSKYGYEGDLTTLVTCCFAALHFADCVGDQMWHCHKWTVMSNDLRWLKTKVRCTSMTLFVSWRREAEKVRWRHCLGSATVRVNLESAAVIQIHFDIEATATSHQPLNIRIVVMRTNEMWDEDDRKMIQIKTIRQCHENTMRRYK